MKCVECVEQLTGYVEGLSDEMSRQAVQAHLDSCDACRAEAEAIAGLRVRLQTNAGRFADAGLSAPVMDRIRRQQAKVRRHGMLWRYKGRLSAAVAAAALVAAVVFAILSRTGTTAYALEQTVEATKAVRSVHMRMVLLDVELGGRKWNIHNEFWAQYGEDGKPIRVRVNYPLTNDGHKVVLWEKDKVSVWMKDKGGSAGTGALLITPSGGVPNWIEGFSDPKAIVDELYEAQSGGKAFIEKEEPVTQWAPVRLTVTRSDSLGVRKVYLIDPKTKLLEQLDTYRLQSGGDYKLVSSMIVSDYNEPVDPRLFVLDVPEDAVRVDERTQVIGLPKGSLTDKEIATKVTREFFEALIARDYAKAGQLLSGMPADRMEKAFKDTRYVRIISLGEPAVQPEPGVGGLVVPYEVEVEEGGQTTVKKYQAAVRPVGPAQPDRWTIHGGI